MTHSLHRLGDYENFRNDYVVLVMSAKGFNDKGSAIKLKKALKLSFQYDPVNYGDIKTGNKFSASRDLILKNIADTSIIHIVFDNKDKLLSYLRELKREDLGISVIVTGVFSYVNQILEKVELNPHTIQCSLGTLGKIELLPKKGILKITTMCGHHQIGPKLVEKLLDDIKRGKVSFSQAATILAKQCVCGIFNPKRAEILLRRLIEED